MLRQTLLFYQDQADADRVVECAGRGHCEKNGILLSERIDPTSGGEIVYVTVENRNREPVRLKWLNFEVDTGFAPAAPARFFKHGYQSWSGSYPSAIGDPAPPQTRSLLNRISHQSESQRPETAPENATSELFTIVESDSSPERFLCGFVGAANQFTTLTAASPSRLIARVLFDGVRLRPGEAVSAEPLVHWRSNQEPAGMAARWAELLGSRMNARVSAAYQCGWCSWYQYFAAITETDLRSNLNKLQELRRELPIDVIQLDDGFQSALGDWEHTNAKFPSGLKNNADQIRQAGFTAGLWIAPFLAAHDSKLMRAHPNWFVGDQNGEPLPVINNPSWTASDDKYAYALDPSNPNVTTYLEQLFARLVHDFSYRYLKIDFLFAAAVEGHRYDPDLTRAQTLRRGLEAIRRGAGDGAFILGCGCPLGPAVGIVDGMRIGPDVAPYWGGSIEPGTRLAIKAIIARSFMHRRLWLNDPDCLMLRAQQTRLSREERFALACAIALSGGMLLISDDMNLLDRDGRKLFRMVADLGREVDKASRSDPPIARTLMQDGPTQTLVARGHNGLLYLFLNSGERARHVSLADLIGAGQHARLIHPDGESEAPEIIELPPHSGRIIRRFN
jgi:alpha-galactosidase